MAAQVLVRLKLAETEYWTQERNVMTVIQIVETVVLLFVGSRLDILAPFLDKIVF